MNILRVIIRDTIFACVLLFLMVLVSSCVPMTRSQYPGLQMSAPPCQANYPNYRIDNEISRIAVVGSGPNADTFAGELTSNLSYNPDITVIEKEKVKALLGGAFPEHSTELSSSQADRLAKMLKLSHILFIQSKISAHEDFKYGGRATAEVQMKIVDSFTGEVLIESSGVADGLYPDPRPYGYIAIDEESNDLFGWAFNCAVFGILYSVGSVHDGTLLVGVSLFDMLRGETGTAGSIWAVIPGSPADKAGIQPNDRIIESSAKGPGDENLQQGKTITGKLQRGQQILDFRIEFPIIPYRIKDRRIED